MLARTPHHETLLPIAAYVCTEEGADVARTVVTATGAGDAGLKGGGLSGAARLCLEAPISNLLVTELGNLSSNDACECVREIRQTGAEVIVIGHVTDISTYRALRNAGALEYFQFPVSAEEILAVQQQKPANDPDPVTPKAMSIGVVGATGGVGASVFAHNLAYIASDKDKNTALVDGDILFGSQAFDLNCKGSPGFIEALAAPDRVDGTFLSATMEKVSDTLSLYAHQISSPQDAKRLDASLSALLPPLRASFDMVVLDLQRKAFLEQPELLDQLSMLVIVLPAGFSGVNATARILNYVKQMRPDLATYIVLSNLRKGAALSRKEIEQALSAPINAVLPRSDAPIQKAQNTGKPLCAIDKRSAYSKAVQGAAKDITRGQALAKDAKASRGGLLGRMFS